MRLNVFKSKIHRATVTHADVAYEGSVSIDADLMDAAEILPYEAVHIWNVTNGSRLVTYALAGARGSGTVCVNGAAAHLNRPGDLVILATYADMIRPRRKPTFPPWSGSMRTTASCPTRGPRFRDPSSTRAAAAPRLPGARLAAPVLPAKHNPLALVLGFRYLTGTRPSARRGPR